MAKCWTLTRPLVVGLGAICGLRTRDFDDDGRSQSFWVSEFARVANGRRVILHEARGFTSGVGSGHGAVQSDLTPDSITHDVLGVVLLDLTMARTIHGQGWPSLRGPAVSM